jgi:hypothetical protein
MRVLRLVSGVVVLLASGTGAVMAGCQSSASNGGDGGAEDGGRDGGTTLNGSCTLVDAAATGVPTCDVCAEAKCCAERNACFGSEPCADYVRCVRTCVRRLLDAGSDSGASQDECRRSCSPSDAALSAYESSATCVATRCAAECP